MKKWDAELSLKLASRALAQSECKFGEQYILERLKEVGEYLKDSNLPSVEEYYNEAKEEITK